MKFPLNADATIVREQIKKSTKVTTDEAMEWNSTNWSHLISIAAGLNPFSAPVTNVIPEVFRAFLPRLEFKPSVEDKKNALVALRRSLSFINKAIIETTKITYDQLLQGSIPNLLEMIQSQFAGGLDEFLGQLQKELMDYEKRKLFLQAGFSMMTPEQAWISRHHTFAVGALTYARPSKEFTSEEFLSLAHDVGILDNGRITFSPFQEEQSQKIEKITTKSKTSQDAEEALAESKKKLLDSLKKKKK